MKAKLDAFLNKYLSRKLMVFIVASLGLFLGDIESYDWVIIGTVYIGTQGAVDIVERLRNKQ